MTWFLDHHSDVLTLAGKHIFLAGVPLVLGLVIAPILEQSLRQSLIMSNGNYLIFFSRPISLGLMMVSIGLLILAAYAFVLHRTDWRTKLAEVETAEKES
jgi:TctA family transporter